MTRLLLFTILFVAAVAAISANEQDTTAITSTTISPGSVSASGPRLHRAEPPPSLWEDSRRYIEQGGSDVGSWMAERRLALVENTIQNPYFWYSAVSLLLVSFLGVTLYFQRISEDRKIGIAIACMTDLWNWALYADAKAREAVYRHNKLADEYNRIADSDASGKTQTLGQSAEPNPSQEEVELLRRDKTDLEQRLAERDTTIRNLTVRVEEIGKQLGGGASPADTKMQVQLLEKVNQLSARNQQLEHQLAETTEKRGRFSDAGKSKSC